MANRPNLFLPSSRRIIRPGDKPSLVHTQRWGIDRKHPLAKDVVVAAIFNREALNMVDNRRISTHYAGGYQWIADGYKNADNNEIWLENTITIGPNLTCIVRLSYASGGLVCAGAGGSYAFYLGSADAIQTSFGGDTHSISSSGIIPTNTWFTLAITKQGSLVTWYKDGKAVGSDNTFAAGNVLSDLQGISGYNFATGGGWPTIGTWDYAFAFNRALSDSEIASLRNDPYQFVLQPGPERIYFDFGGGSTGSYTLTASQGSFTLSGKSTGLLAARKISSSVGSYSLTGQSVNLKAGRKLTTSTGSYTLTGQTVVLKSGRQLTASTGSYTLTGQSVNLKFARILSASTGSFTFTGNTVDLVYTLIGSYILHATAGSFTLSGLPTTLKAARVLTTSNAVFTLTGRDVAFVKGYGLAAGTGSFTLTGRPVSWSWNHVLACSTGSFTLTGVSVTFSIRGQIKTGITLQAAPKIFSFTVDKNCTYHINPKPKTYYIGR